MEYLLSALKKPEECAQVIKTAKAEQKALLIKQMQLEQSQDKYAENSVDTVNELAIVQSQLDNLNLLLPSMPESDMKKDEIINQSRLETKVLTLTKELKNFGAVPMILRQNQQSRIILELSDYASFITLIEDHQAKL